jgi:hypothetical protein
VPDQFKEIQPHMSFFTANRLGFAALGFTCIAAAAGGGYLASRQSVESAPAAAATAPPPAQTPAAVQETEAVLGDAAKLAQPPAEAAPMPEARAEAAVRSTRSEPGQRGTRRPQTVSTRNTQQPPPLNRTWPSSTPAGASTDSGSQAPAAPESPAQNSAAADDRAAPESTRAPEPPAPAIEELVVSANSVIGLQLDTALSSDRARVEDRVEARVVRDVRVGNTVAVPSGAHAVGSVMVVERGGRFKDRARLGIRFHTLVLADGTRVPITTETIYRYGDAPGNASAAKIGGGAVGGAILGAIIGGAKGAAIGATAGAGGGTAAVMATDPSAATFPAGTEVTARILSPVTVTVEK